MFSYRKLKGVPSFFNKLNDRVRTRTHQQSHADSTIRTGMKSSLKDTGTHTFLLMIGSRTTMSVIPGGTPLSHWCMYEWCCLQSGCTAGVAICDSSQRDLGLSPSRQVHICIDLWRSSPAQPHFLPQPSWVSILQSRLTFYSSSDLPHSHMASHWPSLTSQNTSFWLICFSHSVTFLKLLAALTILLLLIVKQKKTTATQGRKLWHPPSGWCRLQFWHLTTQHCKHLFIFLALPFIVSLMKVRMMLL